MSPLGPGFCLLLGYGMALWFIGAAVWLTRIQFLGTLQSFTIFSEKYPPRKATLGIYTFLAALLTVVELVLVNPSPDLDSPRQRLCGILHWVQVAAGLLQGLSSVCLPRRPDVYWMGQVVDGENTK